MLKKCYQQLMLHKLFLRFFDIFLELVSGVGRNHCAHVLNNLIVTGMLLLFMTQIYSLASASLMSVSSMVVFVVALMSAVTACSLGTQNSAILSI